MISASELSVLRHEMDKVKRLHIHAILVMIEAGVDCDEVLCCLHHWVGAGMNVPNAVINAFEDQYGMKIDCRGEVVEQ